MSWKQSIFLRDAHAVESAVTCVSRRVLQCTSVVTGHFVICFMQVKKVAKGIYEGSIVRAIRRLHELLMQMKSACEIIGDIDLSERMEKGAASIHRDVVFAASLYL